jgi:uncharacterized protein (DUF1015 family)
MVNIYPFSALRPVASKAPKIASVPYDVVSTEEVQQALAANPESFLRVIRSDAELPEIAPDDEHVYLRAKENLNDMVRRGMLVQDNGQCFYIYRVKQGGNIYTGIVGCLEVDDYSKNRIKRHELTRYDKEEDRTRHIDVTNANTGLVVLLYRDPGELFSYITSLIPEHEPDALVKMPGGDVHEIFKINGDDALSHIMTHFSGIDSLYIADGHHRAKSAVNVAERRRGAGTVTKEAERFMAILFAENRVKIHGYSRLVTDLGGYTDASFLEALSRIFEVKPYGEIDDTVFQIPPLREYDAPRHILHMYMNGQWFELSTPVADPDDPIHSLDVLILQKKVLEDMLGITDPRADPRLQYLGGARPHSDLEDKVDSGEFRIAFSMQPVKIETVLAIADEGGIMPPKSTWFEPKLLSGLVIHKLD